MKSESLRDGWSTVASALTPDGRVMFVDDGHRARHEEVEPLAGPFLPGLGGRAG
jgi:hypothetical protein